MIIVMRRFLILGTLTAVVISGASVYAQTPASSPAATQTEKGITPNLVVGEVTAMDAAAKQLTVKTDGGAMVAVALADKTAYLRAQPGATTLENATPITLADVRLGDRVMARGKVAEDKRSVSARQVIVMTKEAITEKREREREDWQRRGIVGIVTALNPTTKEVTLQLRSMAGAAQDITLETGGSNVKFRRYAPDSVKFSNAKQSSFAELKAGDQLRAKGEKSADGTRFVPEEVVSGSFRMLRGTVETINAQANELKVKDLQSGQTMTVAVSPDSTLRRIPAEFAARFAARGQGGGQGNGQGAQGGDGAGGARQSAGGNDERRASGGERPGGERRPGGGRRMGGTSFQDFLERMPAVTLAELKPGDMIVVSSTTGADPSRITAIALVAGVEALMQQQAAGRGRGGQGATLGMPQGALDIGIGGP
jgi:hypothetical protein